MFKRLKYMVASLAIFLVGGMVFVPVAAHAANFKNDACAAVNVIDGVKSGKCSSDGQSSLNHILRLVLNVLSFIIGFAAIESRYP